MDDSTVNFECIFPIKINVIIPFTFLSSNMHTDQQNNPIRITLCGFPVLFSQWLSFNLSQKNEIIISAILPDQDSACESDPLDSNVVLLQINSEQQLESINKLNARSMAVLAWWTGNYLNDDLMIQIVNSGASGILADHHLLEDVEKAIRSVANEGFHLNDILSNGLLHYCRKQKIIIGKNTNSFPTFTPREQMVIDLRKQGKTSKEIGHQLCLSKKTIDKVFCDLYRRFNCANFFDILRIQEAEKPRNVLHTSK